MLAESTSHKLMPLGSLHSIEYIVLYSFTVVFW